MDFNTSVFPGGSRDHGKYLTRVQTAIMKAYLSLPPGIQGLIESIQIDDKGSEKKIYTTVKMRHENKILEGYFDCIVTKNSKMRFELKCKFETLVSQLEADFRSEFERTQREFEEKIQMKIIKKAT